MTSDRTDDHGRFSHAADLPRSVARVKVRDTPAPNCTVRVTVEHPDLYRGVRSWLRSDRAGVVRSVRSHLQSEIDADVARLDVTDDAELGLSEAELLGDESDQQSSSPLAIGVSGT